MLALPFDGYGFGDPTCNTVKPGDLFAIQLAYRMVVIEFAKFILFA